MDFAYFPTTPLPHTYNFYTEPVISQDDYATQPLATSDDTTHFNTFDPAFQLNQNALQSPAHSQIGSAEPPLIAQDSSGSMDIAAENENLDMMNLDAAQYEGQAGYTGGGQESDEDKPASELQAKRKAQNRAAQRAFRERKERHVQALKEQLSSTTAKMKNMESDFERLQRENQRLATQNEILQATSSKNHPPSSQHPQSLHPERAISPISGPQRYSPSSTFHKNLMSSFPRHHPSTAPQLPHNGSTASTITTPRTLPAHSPMSTSSSSSSSPYRLNTSTTTGQTLLSMTAAWEIVQNHELYKKGQVNIHELCEKMKRFSTCSGQGPAFPEDLLKKAIEESVGGPGDELL